MAHGGFHVQPHPCRLFARDDEVHVVPTAKAVVCDRKQRVRIRRQIDAHDLRFLVRDMIDESRILMRKTIMVLPPHMRAEQVIQRSDRLPPRETSRRLQPLRMLIEH